MPVVGRKNEIVEKGLLWSAKSVRSGGGISTERHDRVRVGARIAMGNAS